MTPSTTITAASRTRFLLPGVLLMAALVRLYGINWGLPDVYEEATPMRQAWEMWGWGEHRNFDPNPHFFNYPSLTIYVQFFVQVLLLGIMKVFWMVGSTFDFRVAYVLDKTPFVIAGRLSSVLFDIGTVWLAYRIGRIVGGVPSGIAAALLLALNPLHIAKSQVIEVDLPLTFFCTLGVLYALQVSERPTRRDYLMCGLALGLASSSKYTGACLILPLLVAHVTATRTARAVHERRRLWKWAGISLLCAAAVFLITSPFVVWDAAAVREAFLNEREHMRRGHFGLGGEATALFYARVLGTRVVGWPALLLGAAGMIAFAGFRRRRWALVAVAFVVPYLLATSLWSMRADRYLLPIVPTLVVFEGTTLAAILAWRRFSGLPNAARSAIALLALLVLVLPLSSSYAAHLDRLRPDTRTLAKRWMKANVPPGSLVVAEYYTPQLLEPVDLWALGDDVRQEIWNRRGELPLYGVIRLPMFQVEPERSEAFYDLALYESADVIVTSSNIRDRYRSDPEHYARQLAFYEQLAQEFDLAHEFVPGAGTGPTVTLYRNTRRRPPFAERTDIAAPPALDPELPKPSGQEGYFHYSFGLNFETFGKHELALSCYMTAFVDPYNLPSTYQNVCAGIARCLLAQGLAEKASEFLSRAADTAPTEAVAKELGRMRAVMLGP